MQLVDQTESVGPLIRGVASDSVQIGDVAWRESFLIQAGTEVSAWHTPLLQEFGEAEARALIARRPALLILGTGATQAFPPPAFAALLMRAGIGIESMPNRAAARTFNLLVSEGRNVLGAFLLP